MKWSILGERLFVLFCLAENLSAQFQSHNTLGSNVGWIVAPQGSVCQENWGMTHVVAFRVRGGKDPEVKNYSKTQRLNSMGGQDSPTHDAGKCPCSASGWWSRAVGGAEMRPSLKAETTLPQRGKWYTSDPPWTKISRGYGWFKAEPDHWKVDWWQPELGLEIFAEFFPKLQERLSGNIWEMGQDGLSSVSGGKFIRPTSCWLHCDPCNICWREPDVLQWYFWEMHSMSPWKQAAQVGEYILFASRNICFASITLPIITLPPHHLQSPSGPSFAFLAAFTNHM